ncbi:MAG: DUF86 domain-containing protein [Nocardioides sp.]|uniref:HepT-like ribonuclease domain-containing protein n=1 Tax=Nocardioides sp. TaxID=35761 RepID=UPI0039E645DC
MSDPLDERTAQALQDIVGFAAELRGYVVTHGEEHFRADRPTQLVAEALLHRVGEAVSRLAVEFTATHPEVAWRQIKGMRNVVAHQYGFIDYRIVWRALTEDLPRDVKHIQTLLGHSV